MGVINSMSKISGEKLLVTIAGVNIAVVLLEYFAGLDLWNNIVLLLSVVALLFRIELGRYAFVVVALGKLQAVVLDIQMGLRYGEMIHYDEARLGMGILEAAVLIISCLVLLLHNGVIQYLKEGSFTLNRLSSVIAQGKKKKTAEGAELELSKQTLMDGISTSVKWVVALVILNYVYVWFVIWMSIKYYMVIELFMLIPALLSVVLLCGMAWARKLHMAFSATGVMLELISIFDYIKYRMNMPEADLMYELRLVSFYMTISILVYNMICLIIHIVKGRYIRAYVNDGRVLSEEACEALQRRRYEIGKSIIYTICGIMLLGIIYNIFIDHNWVGCVFKLALLVGLIARFSWSRYLFAAGNAVLFLAHIENLLLELPKVIEVFYILGEIGLSILFVLAMLFNKNVREYMSKKS